MKNANLYVPPSNKAPAWLGWVLGSVFSGIIVVTLVGMWKLAAPVGLAGSVAAVAAPAPAEVTTAPAAEPAAAPAVAAAPEAQPAAVAEPASDEPVAAAPTKKAGKHGKGKVAKLAKLKPAKSQKKIARMDPQRANKILAKHDSSSSRASRAKLDRMLGL